MKDLIAVVAGGTGGVGEGIVKRLLEAGTTVIVPVRDDKKAFRLEEYVKNISTGTLICHPADIGDYKSTEDFRDWVISNYSKIDLAVASLGGWYYGYSIHRMPLSDWQEVINSHLNTHFNFIKHFLTTLQNQNFGMYVNIISGAADNILNDSGAISIVSAAQKMLSKVIAKEAEGTDVRIHSIESYTPIITRSRGEQIINDWISALELGSYIIKLYKAGKSDLNNPVHEIRSKKDIE